MKKKLQANIQGFMGKPVSLFGVIDTDTGVLNIVTQASKQQAKKEGCIFITNTPRIEHDFFIDESKLRDAIIAYFRLKRGVAKDNVTPLLAFGNKVGAADPVSTIELAGITETGMDYRIAADIGNLQVATLAMCLYASEGNAIDDALAMFDNLNEIMAEGWMTI